MRFAKTSTALQDAVQLFNSSDSPLAGLTDSDVTVSYQKNGASTFTTKTLGVGDWAAGTATGVYFLAFSASELDTVGLFRYRINAVVPGTFKDYEDTLYVSASLPSATPDPPTINAQTVSPPGITPDPVYRGSTLTINGTNLAAASQVTVNGTSVAISANNDTQIQVTIPVSMDLASSASVEVTTAGGVATSTVQIVLDPTDLPGSGLIEVFGYIHDPSDGLSPYEGASVYARIIPVPDISLGVGLRDQRAAATTDVNGKFSLNLPLGARVYFNIPIIGYNATKTLPSSGSSVNLFTGLPNP